MNRASVLGSRSVLSQGKGRGDTVQDHCTTVYDLERNRVQNIASDENFDSRLRKLKDS